MAKNLQSKISQVSDNKQYHPVLNKNNIINSNK